MKQDANTLKQVEGKQAISKLIYTRQQTWKDVCKRYAIFKANIEASMCTLIYIDKKGKRKDFVR